MKLAITLSTFYVIIYALAVSLTGLSDFTFWLFTFSPLIMFYLVYKILTDDYKETKTFESHFYGDRQMERVKVKN